MTHFRLQEARNAAQDFLDKLRPDANALQPDPGKWIFRGQWNGEFKLKPKAYRKDSWADFSQSDQDPFDPEGSNVTPSDRAERELGLLRQFYDQADEAGLLIPDHATVAFYLEQKGSPTEFFGERPIQFIMALAQHYGIPTRLLDWSRHGLRAAYFAAAHAAPHWKEEGDLSVWALSTDFVDYAHSFERQFDSGKFLRVVTAPRASNANLHAQAGLFTLWGNGHGLDLESVVSHIREDLEQLGKPWTGSDPLVRYNLPWRLAPTVLRLLSFEQIDAARMFPGYDGVVKGMRERLLWPPR